MDLLVTCIAVFFSSLAGVLTALALQKWVPVVQEAIALYKLQKKVERGDATPDEAMAVWDATAVWDASKEGKEYKYPGPKKVLLDGDKPSIPRSMP